MKKLFLASAAYKTLDKIFQILPDKPSSLKLAFIPTAGNPYDDKSWMVKDRDKLVAMGFTVTDVDIENKSPEELKKELASIDVLFVAGGNTFYLLEKARKSGFIDLAKEMIDRGVVYIGSSAGSVLACPTIEFVDGMDDPKLAPSLTSYEGLNVVEYLVMPHYGNEEYSDVMDGILQKWKTNEYEIKLLTDNQAVIVNGEEASIVEA